MKTICIYHKDCSDGFGAAWVVNKALNGFVELHPASYGDTPPCVRGRDVVMVDFSYKREVIDEMARQCNRLVILDHHKTAEADLEGVFDSPKVDGIFDMKRSGAMLAWRWFYGRAETPPTLIKHIQDRDLWRFVLHGTREIMAAVFSYPQEIEVWNGLMQDDMQEALRTEGFAILREHDKNLKQQLEATTRRTKIGGYDVPVANVPYYMASDAGHILGEGEPFAATYYDAEDGRHFSLRSEPDGIDVSEVAKRYGGGGHKHAAGFVQRRK